MKRFEEEKIIITIFIVPSLCHDFSVFRNTIRAGNGNGIGNIPDPYVPEFTNYQ